MELTGLKQKFEELFGKGNNTAFFAPGRINLIGRHTDYNGRMSFLAPSHWGHTLSRQMIWSKSVFTPEKLPGSRRHQLRLADLDHKKADSWADYPKGMRYLKKPVMPFRKAWIWSFSEISRTALVCLSSASHRNYFWWVSFWIICSIWTWIVWTLIKTGKRVENEFIGVNSGIMDQFAVGMGEENKRFCWTATHLNMNWFL